MPTSAVAPHRPYGGPIGQFMTNRGRITGMRDERVQLPLTGIRLPDARSGELLDLGRLPGVAVLTLIRHRF